jgi:aminoglycoside phosphotransferase (APT) family kinase protein
MAQQVDQTTLDKIAAAAAPGAHLVATHTYSGGLESITMLLEFADDPPLVARVYLREDQRDGVAARRYWDAITALASSDLPVPAPVYLDVTGELVGVPVLVITRVPGEPSPPPTALAAWIAELATGLVRIHAFDVAALPSTFRRGEAPVDHVARLVRRHASGISGQLGVAVVETLVRVAPRVEMRHTNLVHGDYWFGNTLWSDGAGPSPRMSGILDWSASRIADPGFDLAASRMDLALVLGGDADEQFRARYLERHPAPREQPFWDLVVGIAGLALADDWVPTYHALGWTHLTPHNVRARLETFVRRALADVDHGARA